MAQREMSSGVVEGVRELLIDLLRETYWLEKKLVRMFDKFQELAAASSIKHVFADHSEQTQTHVSRLELVFNYLKLPTSTKVCPIISDIADSSINIVKESTLDMSNRDTRLVLITERAKRYEIAVYHKLLRFSILLEYTSIEPILRRTLEEEQTANALFLSISDGTIKDLMDSFAL